MYGSGHFRKVRDVVELKAVATMAGKLGHDELIRGQVVPTRPCPDAVGAARASDGGQHRSVEASRQHGNCNPCSFPRAQLGVETEPSGAHQFPTVTMTIRSSPGR